MTLEEAEMTHNQNMMAKVIGTWLTSVLKKAKKDQRLVSGMYKAAKALECNSDNILACILPQNHLDDAGVHINHVLLEAFCYENNVHVLKVDSEETLAKILLLTRECYENDVHRKTYDRLEDFGCILLQTWKGRGASRIERHLLEMHRDNCNRSNSLPFIVQLPLP